MQVLGESRPLAALAQVSEDFRDAGSEANSSSIDQRCFFIPDVKILVTVPAAADKIFIRKVDVDDLLEKSGIDYFHVASSPPLVALTAKDYRYEMAVRSKHGGVRYKLEAGPAGMELAADGVLTWPVPADHVEGEVNVIVSIADKTGREIYHTFRISVVRR